MEAMMLTKKIKALSRAFGAISIVAVLGLLLGSTTYASRSHNASDTIRVVLSPLTGAPAASGEVEIQFVGTVMQGSVEVKNLPSQAFGSGHFYGVWFVRTDTGDKAFLGALVGNGSIIFSSGGDGKMKFAATQFTDPSGPHAGSPITLGGEGTNLIIVLIEDNINGKTPSPIGQAVSGTF